VLDAAVAVADREGLAALTMRSLAGELGVKPMSLYHHVSSKDEILDAIVDAVFAEIELPMQGTPWREAMERRARSARVALGRHPWAVGLLESRAHPGPATLRHHDAVLGCLRESGFSLVDAAHAYALLDSFIYGFAVQESALPFDDDNAAEVIEQMTMLMAGGEYPYLAEMATDHAMQPGYDFGDEFAVGLGLILDALATLRGRGRSTRAGRS
jgi:AcrR family transcriptional regulator